jgi:hypothetical protein
MRSRTIYRHFLIRAIVYPIILLAILYTMHFAADLLIPAETTAAHRAQAAAYLATHDLPTPDQPFAQDGCTLFPDQLPGHDFRSLCLKHDIAYWAGGPPERQYAVNQEFRRDVAAVGPLGPILAWPMYLSVAYVGDNGVSRVINSHWGYGWN